MPEDLLNQEQGKLETEQTQDTESQLEKALKSERQLRRDYEKKAKEIEQKLASFSNISIEEYEQLKTFKTEQEQKAEETRLKELEAKQQYETVLKEKELKYQSEIQQREQLIAELKQQIEEKENFLVVKERNTILSNALLKSNAFPETVNFLLKDEFVLSSLKFENGEITPVNKNNELLTDGKGNMVTLDQWIEGTLKTRYPHFFKGINVSGTGMTPPITSAKGNNGMTSDDFLRLSASEALARARK